MTSRLFPLLRNAMYALRGGFLVRPLVIAIALGLCGAVLSSLEETVPALSAWVPSRCSRPSRPPGRADHPQRHRHLDHDCRVDRLRHPADDADAGVDAVLAAHPDQLRPRPRDAVDAGHLPRHLRLLHGRLAGRALVAAPLCAGRHGHRRHAAGAGLRRLADLLHPSHLAGDQRQPHRRPHRARDRAGDRRVDAALAPTRL